MKSKRVIGILCLIIGVVALYSASYINDQVNEGKEQIESGQQKVDIGNQLFSLSPYTKDVGKGITDPVQKKLDEGQEKVTFYTGVANFLHRSGIGLVIFGLFFLSLSFFRKKS